MTDSILKDISEVLEPLGIPIETGLFSEKPPSEYIVLVPMSDIFDHYADDMPGAEFQEVRLSLFSKSNYQIRKSEVVKILIDSDFTITDRRYVGYEEDTGFHHYTIDILKIYELYD